jgi:hypothetical protein
MWRQIHTFGTNTAAANYIGVQKNGRNKFHRFFLNSELIHRTKG